jgi:DNA-binding protein H-NS
MTTMDLDHFSLKELKDLQSRVARAITTFEERKRKEAMAAVEESARSLGFSISELFGTSTASRKRSPGAPKYANPANPSETWTGRGRKPRWVEAALKQGKSLDDLSI